MIVSQIWALLGMFKADHFRSTWPLAVPIHISLYVIHMLQEIFEVHSGAVIDSSASKKKTN